jgi:WSC domain
MLYVGVMNKFRPFINGTSRSHINSEVGRTLNGASYSNDTTMTDESCISFCSAKGFLYAGTEYASQCCELSSSS